MLLRFMSLILLSLLAGCSWFDKSEKRQAAKLLSQEHAEYRSQIISDVQYDLKIDLTNDKIYQGTVKIEFLAKASAPVTIDFSSGVVKAIRSQGKAVTDFKYNTFFIDLPASALVAGSNVIEVDFSHDYNKSGSGLYRFVDPQDKKPYLYTDFEPYDANVFIPCFDQPDLKATYMSTVTAPKEWTVISTNREVKVLNEGENKVWRFPRSKKLSTYIYSLHAGPYKMWTSEVKTQAHVLPLRLFSRQSMAPFVNPEEWFVITRQGFQFFENYFSYPYPYEKYDQVIVPDFNSGAMENVGAVTFNERFLSRGVKSRMEKRNLANVILHEMAHMWFGNLVTMKWWNDIWLNESFATIAAYIGLSQATEFKESWTEFIVGAKGSAYFSDQLVTTHPIAFEVANTDVVFANFDGITYGKGASVLKQLMFYLGEENFKKGLKNYFSTHAFKNTTLNDFIQALEQASEKNLQAWKKDWLEVAQVNTLKVDYKCSDDKISSFEILQSAPKEYPVLREHRTRVALFDYKNNNLKLLKAVDVTYKGEKTLVPDVMGMSCSDIQFIYPNFEDHDYVKIDFDDKSLATLEKHITSFSDEIIKVGSWRALSEMLVDGRIHGFDYLKIFYAQAGQEQSAEVLISTLGQTTGIVRYHYPEDGDWLARKQQEQNVLAQFLLDNAKNAKNAEVQRIWFNNFVAVTPRDEDHNLFADILKTNKAPLWLKYPLNQDDRWDFVTHLAKWGKAYSQELITTETKRDSSALGENSTIGAQAALPTLDNKKKWWAEIVKGPTETMPLGKLRYAIGNLFYVNQQDLEKEFADVFFKDLLDLKGKPVEFLSAFASLAPGNCSTDSVSKTKQFLEKHSRELPETVIKRLKTSAQMTERCLNIRANMAKTKAVDPA